jgi:hypothetical protein
MTTPCGAAATTRAHRLGKTTNMAARRRFLSFKIQVRPWSCRSYPLRHRYVIIIKQMRILNIKQQILRWIVKILHIKTIWKLNILNQKSSDKLFTKHSFWKILNTWFNPTGEFLGEPGNIQVIKNWQSHKYTEQETIRMIKILHKSAVWIKNMYIKVAWPSNPKKLVQVCLCACGWMSSSFDLDALP